MWWLMAYIVLDQWPSLVTFRVRNQWQTWQRDADYMFIAKWSWACFCTSARKASTMTRDDSIITPIIGCLCLRSRSYFEDPSIRQQKYVMFSARNPYSPVYSPDRRKFFNIKHVATYTFTHITFTETRSIDMRSLWAWWVAVSRQISLSNWARKVNLTRHGKIIAGPRLIRIRLVDEVCVLFI